MALSIRATIDFAFHDSDDWYRDRDYLNAVVDVVSAGKLWKLLKVAGVEDRARPFKGIDEAKGLVSLREPGAVVLQDRAGDEHDLLVRLGVAEGSLEMLIWCQGAPLEKLRKSLLDDITAIARGTRVRFDGTAGIRFGWAYPNDFEYPRPRPPRYHDTVPLGSVLDLIDLTFHRSGHDDAAGEGAERLAGSDLPAGATRTTDDDLIAIRWTDDAADEKKLARGCTAHERWMASILPTEIEDGYNELGDEQEARGKTAPARPLTAYSPSRKAGYKAVAVFPDGSVDDKAWGEAFEVLRAGRTGDGKPVEELFVIAPVRAAALAIGAKARKAGFAGVLYPDDAGIWWNPDPAGEWDGPATTGSTDRGDVTGKKGKARKESHKSSR